MALDFSSDFISGIWNMLYDDDYFPDYRGIENGIVSLPYSAMFVLCSVYPCIAGNHGSKRDLFFTACSRSFNDNCMYGFNKTYEKEYFKKYEYR